MLNRLFQAGYRLVQAVLLLGLTAHAYAVPSFARQTGLACIACHSAFPELNAFGRSFKLNGYTMSTVKQVASDGPPTLKISEMPPLSLMFLASGTQIKTAVPDSSTPGKAQNGNIAFPQQLSLFYAGAVTEHIGTFAQLTYTRDTDKISLDNVDIRYAQQTTVGDTAVNYGLTLNNNPTVEDLWQSTPAWGFPFTGSETAPGPMASTLIDGALAQDVAGLGGYLGWGDHWYGNFSLYRSEHAGSAQPYDSTASNTIAGVAPYWRLAYQTNFGANYLELGTYGLRANMHPSGVSGETNGYMDTAIDGQWERTLGQDHGQVIVRGTYIHERTDWREAFAGGSTSNARDTLNTFKINAAWHPDASKSLTLGYFNTQGSQDSLLYAAAPVEGSASGSPNTRGWLVQGSFYQAQNVQLGAQYTWYNAFNGGSSNYDGSGRSAKDNNTLYVYTWIMW